jgi:outer membrane protein OmpA-like peptidoglycan-associated protein
MKKIVTCCLVFILLSTTLMAQKAKLERANREFEGFNYSAAIVLYQEILEKNDISEAKIKLAESFRKVDNMGEAEYWYGQIVHLPEAESIYLLHYAQALQANGKCDLAKEWFNKYNEVVGDTRSGHLITACDKEVVDQLLRTRKDFYEIQHLKQINTKYDDFGPAFYKEGLVFSSERDNAGPATRIHDWTGFPFLELYYSDVDTVNAESLEFSYDDKPSKYDTKLNTKYHDGPIAFSPDEGMVYFTRNNIDERSRVGKDSEGIIRLKVFSAKNKDSKWSELKGMPFNSDEYSVAHPTISADGNTMYFSSDMPGGFGGMDLYYSNFDGGQWAPPKNMGPRINTEGHEVFPVIHPKTGRLYFSSDGHAGLGMMDIFFVDNNEGVWGAVINIGFPINSNADDHGLILNEAENFGYFVSNRDGGVGRDDIYSFRYSAVRIEVLVYDENTGEPIEEADVLNDCSNMQLKTGANGKVIFEMPLNKCCTFLASKQTYDDNKRDTCTNGMKTGTEILVKIPLSRPLDFEIEGVVYDEKTGEVIADAKVTLIPDCTGTPIIVVTDDKGYYNFFLNKKCCYDLKVEKKDYLTKSADKPYCTKGLKESKKFIHNFYLNRYLEEEITSTTGGGKPSKSTGYTTPSGEYISKPKPEGAATGYYTSDGEWVATDGGSEVGPCPVTFVLEHIYYDFDKAYIRSDAEEPLAELIKILEDNPDVIVEIGSHTDARGSSRYNEKLSQRRAKSVVKYLEGRGIPANRLEYQGYGETQTTNECVDEIPCDEEKHQRNRRTEFRVVGLVDGTRFNCDYGNMNIDEYSVEPIVLKKIDRCENCPF